MCGIAGVVSSRPIDDQLLERLVENLKHRGPDDEGFYRTEDRTAALAHTRLSILDLSPAGRQPMSNEACPRCAAGNRPLWITCNGEIYNFPQLQRGLRAKGHRFRSKTDTEVLLHLYAEEGAGFVQQLLGMFAFGLYDARRSRLLLARDRLGLKPLYYACPNGNFLFASEIKAILASGWMTPEPDWQALSDYFSFGFAPHPQTAFRRIRELPPAHTLTFDLRTRRLRMERYWTPWEGPPPPRSPSYAEAKERVRTLTEEAVRSRMISDVPIGVFFSGGIDSTLVAALMSRHCSGRVKTFTVIFPEGGNPLHDDTRYARTASRLLGTEHHELAVTLETPDRFLETIRFVDQPFANATLYLQYLIARTTRKEVKVALSGVGGDELFGGYPKYRLLPWAPLLQRIPRWLGRAGRACLSALPERRAEPVLRRAKRLLKGVGFPLPEQYLRWCYPMTFEEKAALLRGSLRPDRHSPAARAVEAAFKLAPPGTDRFGRVFSAELQMFLADNLLAYTDRASMAVGLETRAPLLDHRLVNLAARIPFRDKIRWGKSKRILVDAFEGFLPREVAAAPKRGFSPPMGRWTEKVLDRYFERTLDKRRVEKEGLFSWEALQSLRREHRSGRRDASAELLQVMMFDAWHERYILNRAERTG